VDKNFAVHLPVIDLVFGTFHLPGHRWPARYGLEGDPVPESYLRQLAYPFPMRMHHVIDESSEVNRLRVLMIPGLLGEVPSDKL
jgi:hypothetical protein